MLILSRKIGQTIIIGEGENEVRITIVRIMGGRVSVGIDAPKSIPIVREELNTNSGE